MADVDIAPHFGLELKVGVLWPPYPPASADQSAHLGWLQDGECLGFQWDRLAGGYPAVLPGTECDREGIQRETGYFGQEVL